MPDNPEKNRFLFLFSKYLNDNCSEQEADEILRIFEDRNNDTIIRKEAVAFMGSSIGSRFEGNSLNKVLDDLHKFTGREKPVKRFDIGKTLRFLSRIAAILFIPLSIYTIFLSIPHNKLRAEVDNTVIQTIKVPAGSQAQFTLPDGSNVWLNSGSVFKYPVSFSKGKRQVELIGEGYFDIIRNPANPFFVNAGKLNVEVKGTKFVVINYPEDPGIEVILESGIVEVSEAGNPGKTWALSERGDLATFNNNENTMLVAKDDIDKYTSWKDGVVIFRDDPMSDVARRLSHRFNVEIVLEGDDVRDYVYTATFKNESLKQILELLETSAPIEYNLIEQERLYDGSFSKSKIIISKIRR